MSESENSQDSGTQPVDVEMEEELDLTPEPSAEHFKEEGNTLFKNKQYDDAVSCYSQAISLCPTCAAYYGNRSAAYIMLNKYREALADARHALSLDNTFIKAYLREGKCLMALGDPTHAMRSYTQVLELDPNNSIAKTELKSAKALHDFEQKAILEGAKGDHRTMLYCIDQCLNFSPHCFKYKTQRAECLALLGRYQEAQELANDILQRDRINPDALYVRGICLYYQDNPEKAFNHFQEVLRLAPDHFKARETYRKAKYLLQTKQEGNTAFKEGRYKEAYEIYSKALEIDPHNRSTNSKLYCNRATVASKLGKLEESVQDCTKAVELDCTYVKAFMRRAKSYMDLEQYEEAVRDYETVHKLEKTRDTKRLLQEAKLELKKSKRKDYYKILGVTKHASEEEIKKAYKKRALIHHPDRHSHDTPEKQKEEEKKFKELGEAYGVLSDPKKRSRYDSGQDLEDFDGGFSDHIDPNQIFQAFFGGGGAGFPGHGYPGAGYSSGGGGGGGFPPGFSFHFG